MFTALNENNERIDINKADKSQRYFCPICGKELYIKATDSFSVRTHFAHKSKCLDTWKHDMSEWHYNWQCLFPIGNREVVVEKDGVIHRADILINNVVIEFQHSPITAEEITKRNNFYLSCGYTVVWVFDANDKIKNSFEKDGSIDPNRLELWERLVWKTKQAKFDIPTPKNVFVFIEYTANVSYPPQQADIMLWLTSFTPKEILFHDTCPMYITRLNFLKQFGGNVPDNTLSVIEVLDKGKKIQKELESQRPKSQMVYYIPKGQNKRHSRL
jgi:hypothetical protein